MKVSIAAFELTGFRLPGKFVSGTSLGRPAIIELNALGSSVVSGMLMVGVSRGSPFLPPPRISLTIDSTAPGSGVTTPGRFDKIDSTAPGSPVTAGGSPDRIEETTPGSPVTTPGTSARMELKASGSLR